MRSPFADANHNLIFQIEIGPDEVWIKEIPAGIALPVDGNAGVQGTSTLTDGMEAFEQAKIFQTIHTLVQSRWKSKNEYGKIFSAVGNVETREKYDKDFVLNCLEEIYKGIESSDFGLIHLLGRIGMSRSSFYRKIKEVTGLRPVDFIRKAKLQYAAKKLLVNSNMRVCEIAWESGFSDIKYFSKLFAKEFGKLPSKFKSKSVA